MQRLMADWSPASAVVGFDRTGRQHPERPDARMIEAGGPPATRAPSRSRRRTGPVPPGPVRRLPYLRIRANVLALSITSTTFRLKARSLSCGESVRNRVYMSNRHRASMSSGSFATRVCSVEPSVL